MFKTIPLITFAVWLFAGAAQAGALDAQADQEQSTIAQKKEAPAPTANVALAEAAGEKAAKKAEQDLSPDAKTTYLDGGYFGGAGGN